jgi:NTE family protein
LALLLLVYACAHYPPNAPLARPSAEGSGYSFSALADDPAADRTFVALTFSGGGTRAAALAYGVLEKMKNLKLPGTDRRLLEEIDLISTVSGGSFTGAYFGLYGEGLFADFKTRFLYRDLQDELFWQLWNPYNWIRLASPVFSRIDLAAELYDRTIFDSHTFADLARTCPRPFIIINATNLHQGARFAFTAEQFHYLGSDLGPYPIARAVAASSAFPFLLAPVTLKNHPFPPDYRPPESDLNAVEFDFWVNRRRYQEAAANLLYTDKAEHPYVHLMDGGLADNIGLRAVEALYRQGGIREKINQGLIRRFLLIVVNAKTEKRETSDRRESPPGLAEVAYKTSTVAMDNFSFETVESFKQLIAERAQAQNTIDDCQRRLDAACPQAPRLEPIAGGRLKGYVAELSFDNLANESERRYFKDLPTSFALRREEVDRLIAVGGRLLAENPQFQTFLQQYEEN